MSITLKTIAEEVGTSISTVSLALANHPRVSERTKERVWRTSLKLGYCTQAELEAKRRGRLARDRVRRYQFVALGPDPEKQLTVDGLQSLLVDPRTDGFRVELVLMEEVDGNALVNELKAHSAEVDGFLLSRGVANETLAAMASAGLAVVQIGTVSSGLMNGNLQGRIAGVGFDLTRIACEATTALLSAGFRRIALVSARGVGGLYYDLWEDGYRLALAKANRPIEEALIDRTAGRSFADAPPFAAAAVKPEAFVCPDPTHACQLLAACRRHGIPCGAERMVVGGSSPAIARSGLAGYPAMVLESALMVQRALQQLHHLVSAPPGCYYEVNLSPRIINLESLGTRN